MNITIESLGLRPDEISPNGLDKKSIKRIQQQEKRLVSLGATDTTLPGIRSVLQYLDSIEFSNAIPARDELYKRLVAISQGAIVPLVLFNCLDFAWQEEEGSYPLSRILDDTTTAISGFFSKEVEETVTALQSLSPDKASGTNLFVVVPDSELFDERVFRYAQNEDERIRIGTKVKADLSQRLFGEITGSVVFWSEYCELYGLTKPEEYTRLNAERLTQSSIARDDNPREQNVYRSLQKQISDSKQYLVNNGLSDEYVEYGVPRQDRRQRTLWYCAMYMGEGQALTESNAIALNLEDPRVSKWFNIGSQDKLPILTPVNPSKYYQWRNAMKSADKATL